ncbi:hypothetical protein E6A44_015465 [Pedobacter ureilyticus]|uniref:Uncharacterized protein n=2 Tax=Pedobacter ureilyticus TaxID=1393051 RepID=A0ABW9JAT8_9SPHI|nr:hypothetical protein [Pedobacter helvus]
MKHFTLNISLLFLTIIIANCRQETEKTMEETRSVYRTATVIEDDFTPPPIISASKFKSINEWLTNISENEKPEKTISHFKIGLIESPKENALYLIGRNLIEKGDTSHSTLDFEPKEMYFLIPSDQYKNLGRKEMLEKIVLEIKKFTETEAFKTSFLVEAKDLVFESTGEVIWQKDLQQ